MTILLTKVRPPQRRKDVLRRVRLIDALHQNLHRKLTFVSAPAGYGKTTLLVDFSADVDAIVCWYRISPDDNDIVQFARHLLAAFQQQVKDFGPELEEKLSSPGGSPDAASLAIDFINEVEQKVGDFCLLVLDDYHLAGENQQIVDFIENFLEHLPDHLRILIGSRSVYGIPTASLYIRDELVTIGADELRFRADELQRLVLQNHRIRLSDEQAEEFAKRADGWIIAILLALRTMENGILPRFSGGIEQVYKYLAEEVVNRQSEELRDFMLATSILGDFNKQLCDFLLERNDTGDLLRSLEERNLFVSRTETLDGPSYRYHQLFSDFLQDYFARTNRSQLQALHRRAAEWHRVREDWEAAIQHKLASGDREQAAAWMDQVAREFYVAGRQSLIAKWVQSLAKPPSMQRVVPRLLLYQSKFLVNQSKLEASIKLLNMAEPVFRDESDYEMLANVAITRGMIARLTGKYRDAISLADEAQGLLARLPGSEGSSEQWYQAERLKGLPMFYISKPEEAIALLKVAVDGFRDLSNAAQGNQRFAHLYDLAETQNDLGLIYISTGQMLGAQQAFQEALDIHVSLHNNLGALALARNNVAYLHHQTGHYPEAWREYELALENAKSANRVREQIGILNGKGELLLDIGEVDEALVSFEHALGFESQDGRRPELAATYTGMAKTERQRGNYSQAMDWLRKAASFPTGSIDETEYTVELGSIYAEMGQRDLALKQFEKALEDWPEDATPKQGQVLGAFLAARTLFQSDKLPSAKEHLTKALEGAAMLGYDEFLVTAARGCKEFTRHYLEAESSAQVKALFGRAANFVEGKSILSTSAVIEVLPQIHLEVRAFGTGEIRNNGELVPSSIWRSTRSRALFFYILDRGKVRKEEIGLQFWPDFSTGKISSNFHATLWRVRQALGFKDAIVFEDDHYKLHPSIQPWYDVSEFESYIQRSKDRSLSEREREEMLRQAVALYLQPYLQDLYMQWADERREQLRNMQLDALLELASLESASKRYREAQQIYEKVLAADPYRDEVHLELMKSLASSGSPSAALAHFKDYKALLRKELNAEPLPELQKYYDQLVKSQGGDSK
jgi:ATP/maltotriose-dependent transcriptional regulator MalT/DNA-binding SARP family transcriptional activator